MRKIISVFLGLLISISLLTSCDFDAPLRKKMTNYYANDSNYIELRGVVISTSKRLIEIDILTQNHNFPINAETGYGEFVLVDYTDKNFELMISDEISFTSAPMHFYNGHILPIISLEKEGEVLLSFDNGKDMYLDWIQKTFDGSLS